MTWKKLGLRVACRLPLAAAPLPRELVARALAAGITDLGTLNNRACFADGGEPPFAASPDERLAIKLACQPERIWEAYQGLIATLAERN